MTDARTINKLTNLLVDEISGVDKAANLYEGFLVMKSEGGERVDENIQELLDQADVVVKEVNSLYEGLDVEEGIFVAAPENVQKAATTVRNWLDTEILNAGSTQKSDDKPSFMARAIAALLGTSTEKREYPGPDGWTDEDFNDLCKQIAEGGTKEEVA